MSVIIDRRLNDRNKSATNRERFMRRYKAHLQRAVADMASGRSIRDMERGGTVRIPTRDIAEPVLRHGQGGDRETVFSGNRKFVPGDRLRRPPGGGQGPGDQPGEGGEGDGEDGFSFTLSRDEFMSLFFDDLELPNLERSRVGEMRESTPQRAGYTQQGAPTNLSVTRSLRNAIGRRIALTAAARRRLAEAEQALAATRVDELEAIAASVDATAFDLDRTREGNGPEATTERAPRCDGEPDTTETQAPHDPADAPEDERRAALEAEVAALKRRIASVPFLDDIDLRYRNRVMVPKPISQAVMFCLMDVSASMDERKKELAKRFYTLLYLFLSRKYEQVDVVFVRHTDDAEEVDEERFFHDPKTGGTIVLSALQLMHEIIVDRYPSAEWNIYGAQASDGDAFGADPEKSRGFLADKLMPLVRHFAYVEVGDEGSTRHSTLSAAYRRIDSPAFAMRGVQRPGDIYPVFRDLFAKRATARVNA